MLPQTPQLHLGALEHVFSLRLLSQFFCLTPWRYRKKNHPHVKKVGHTSEFFIGIYWWTLKNRNNHNFEKIKKKFLEISSFYTCVPNTTTIWGTVPEIPSEKNLFCHFGRFFALYPTPLPTPILRTRKTKVLRKWKKHLEMPSF